MGDEWRFTTHSITKYNPIYRNEKGHYKKDEWIGFFQRGEEVGGQILTVEDYLFMEDKYIQAAQLYFKFHDREQITIRSLEKYSFEGYDLNDRDELIDFFNSITDNASLTPEQLITFIKLVLRDLAWAELYCQGSDTNAIRFGYDFYMYFNSDNNLEGLFEDVRRLGLYVD